MMFSIKRLLKSFKSAGRGIVYVFENEQNFRIQIFVGILVMTMAVGFPLRTWEMILMILLILMVLIMEILNTALEKLNDLLKPRLHHYVYVVKDIMAGGVLLTSLVALLIGLIIFIPYLVKLFK
ncbi:MAG: diacylglycerol kinase [bacterium]